MAGPVTTPAAASRPGHCHRGPMRLMRRNAFGLLILAQPFEALHGPPLEPLGFSTLYVPDMELPETVPV